MNIVILFSTRIIRLFCYGFLSVILALYLTETGLTETQIGVLFTLTLIGDAGISLWLTTSADRVGRKKTLLVGALLMAGAGVAFVMTREVVILMIAAIIGVISPSGNEIGPFLSVEQASLTQLVSNEKRTQVLRGTTWQVHSLLPPARYQAVGSRRHCKTTAGRRSMLIVLF